MTLRDEYFLGSYLLPNDIRVDDTGSSLSPAIDTHSPHSFALDLGSRQALFGCVEHVPLSTGTCRARQSPLDSVGWDCAREVDFDLSYITALAEGKGDSFYRTCAELTFFLQDIGRAASNELSDPGDCLAGRQVAADADTDEACRPRPLRLSDLLRPYQGNNMTVNTSFRHVRIPDGWILPTILLQPWDEFALIQDVLTWDLHEHTSTALRLVDTAESAADNGGDLHLYTDGSACDGVAG